MLSYLLELKQKGEFHPKDQDAIENIIHEILTSTEFEINIDDFKVEFEFPDTAEHYQCESHQNDHEVGPKSCRASNS